VTKLGVIVMNPKLGAIVMNIFDRIRQRSRARHGRFSFARMIVEPHGGRQTVEPENPTVKIWSKL
jgi:hypothetical protein